MTEPSGSQPRILGFLCNWCSYAGADLAGVSRFQYPPTLRVIRVMCSGRVDPVLVLRAFARGADAVMILGCHPGDCRYSTGNYYAGNRAEVLKQLLELAGLGPDRLVLDWVSAGEGQRFADLVKDFSERVQALEPLHLDAVARRRLLATQHVVENERIRWLVGRKRDLLERGDVYGQPVDQGAYEALLRSSVATEYLRNILLLLADEVPLSVKEMAAELGVAPRAVLPEVMALEQQGLVAMMGIEGSSPKYRRMQRAG